MTDTSIIQEATTNAAAGFQAGLASTLRIEEIRGVPHLLNPITGKAESLEYLLDKPVRDKTTRELATVESFNEYVKRFKLTASSIYVHQYDRGYTVEAELDHRSETELAWPGHSAKITLKYSEALARWIESNKRTMSQAKFADLLEERSREIVSPSAADMLELANTLHVTRNLSLKSLVRSNRSANALSFNTEQSLKGGAGDGVELPTSFEIQVEPFARHREKCRIKVLLRPRIEDDKPVFSYELQLLEESVEEALTTILGGIETQTALPIYR